jgi:hypothetical protein
VRWEILAAITRSETDFFLMISHSPFFIS